MVASSLECRKVNRQFKIHTHKKKCVFFFTACPWRQIFLSLCCLNFHWVLLGSMVAILLIASKSRIKNSWENFNNTKQLHIAFNEHDLPTITIYKASRFILSLLKSNGGFKRIGNKIEGQQKYSVELRLESRTGCKDVFSSVI